MPDLQETCPAVRSPRAQIWCQRQPLVGWQSLVVPEGDGELMEHLCLCPSPELRVAETRHHMVAPALCTSFCSVTSTLNSSSCHNSSKERIFAGREPVLCSCGQQGGCRTALFSEQNRRPSLMFALLGFWLGAFGLCTTNSAASLYILYLYIISIPYISMHAALHVISCNYTLKIKKNPSRSLLIIWI